MAVTTVEANNKLIHFTKEINREYVRDNLFSPYMSDDLNAIIRRRYELKNGGEQMNIPMVLRLSGVGVGSGTLVGNEEKIDNYGMRVWLDWKRTAVTTTKAQEQKDSADIFGEAKPLLSDWGKETQRDDIVQGFMALPSEAAPSNLGTDSGQTINGILFEAATAAQKNTWNVDNVDRVLYGGAVSNYNATFATALATLDQSADTLTAANLALAKRRARLANPKLRPWKLTDGREYFVYFAGTNAFRALKASLETINKDARPREGAMVNGATNNPIFQDGDQIYDGVIVREIPEISSYVTDVWTSLTTAGASSGRVEPGFLCGQQAMVMAWGQMAKPTFRREDDYQFITGTGVEMAYGVAKMFKKTSGSLLKQWGVLTHFTNAALDA